MISFILILTQFLACILINFEKHENLAVVVFKKSFVFHFK